jgi:phosphonate transport system substrate-binding protein
MKLGIRWSRRSFLGAAALLGVTGLTVIFYTVFMDIERDYTSAGTTQQQDSLRAQKPIVYIGAISRYPPTIMYRGYQPMMDYLSQKTRYRFELLLSQDYNEALKNLLSKRASAVFLGSYLYVQAHARYGIVPVLKPLNENLQPLSRSVLIVGERTSIHTIPDLIGKRLALPSPESFSAHWFIEYECRRNGLAPDQLAAMQHFSHHNTVVAQVVSGAYDAGVTRELLVKDLLGKELRAVAYSAPIPSSPLVVLKDFDPEVVAALKNALLAVNTEANRNLAITRGWDSEFINGFVEATDADYAPVLEIVRVSAGEGAQR